MEAESPESLESRLHNSTDAEVWADEFLARYGQRQREIDRYVLITWFANAIQTGVTHGARKEAARHPEPLRNFD